MCSTDSSHDSKVSHPDLETRRAEIARLRVDEGLTLQEIGNRFGITRERVRQILLKSGIRMPDGGVTFSEAALRLNCSHFLLRRAIENIFGRVSVAEQFPRGISEQELARLESALPVCSICGERLTRKRRKYCSARCYSELWKYKNWSTEKKAKHIERCKHWAARNPQKTKLIQKRASHRYQRRLTRLKKLVKLRERGIFSFGEDGSA